MLTLIGFPNLSSLTGYTEQIYYPATDTAATTQTATFAGTFFTDLLPWAGSLLLIVAAGLLLAAIVRRISGGFKRILGGGRKTGRRYR